MLTPSAATFVGPLTFAALSRHPVETDVLGLLPDERIGHIVVADTADAIVVAPATARWLGAMANGLVGDAVTAACLATSAPVVVAPAMDGDMWTHPATQANVARLRDDFGYRLVPPASGSSRPGSRASGGWRSSGRSSTPWSRRSARGRSGPPIPRRARRWSPMSATRTWRAATSS